MKVVLTKKSLLEAVRTAAHAISARNAAPILQHILICTDEQAVRLSATDQQIGISTTVPAQVLEPGELTLQATLATDVISALPEADIVLESNQDHKVQIKCPPADYELLGLLPNEFPGLPEVPDAVWFEMEAKALRSSLKRTSFASSTDELRTALVGVLFVFKGDTLKMIATDTRRIALDTRMIASGDGEAAAIVPARAVAELQRVLPEEGTVRVHISPSQIMFKCGDITLTANLIEGQFPDYERIIPTSFDKKWVVPTVVLAPAVRRTSIVARHDLERSTFKTEGEKITISAMAPAIGKSFEEVEAVREGDDLEIALNAQYLTDVLAVMESEGVEFHLTQALAPVLIRPADEDEYVCVVMPMQLKDSGLAGQ